MQISMWVPYDEGRLRRTIKIVLRPQMRLIRVLGAVLVLVGLLLATTGEAFEVTLLAVVLGVVFMTAMSPLVVGRTVRMQSHVIKDGFHMTLTEEWLTVAFPLAETKYRWAGVDRVVETPEAWYLMLGKVQSITVPKETMTDAQRAEFAAFLTTEQQRQASRSFLGQPR
ncbi:YcxB family protein [Dactylosporangium sp. NPDC049525]|uniref:YcxB family protein n=1 Tax=Dactylosporangium sp. NPDC049525 TaxID=3154730 RepID=UPI003419BC75